MVNTSLPGMVVGSPFLPLLVTLPATVCHDSIVLTQLIEVLVSTTTHPWFITHFLSFCAVHCIVWFGLEHLPHISPYWTGFHSVAFCSTPPPSHCVWTVPHPTWTLHATPLARTPTTHHYACPALLPLWIGQFPTHLPHPCC